MQKRLLILLIISVFHVLCCYSQTVNIDDRLRQIILKDGQAEVTIPYTDRKNLDELSSNVSIASVKANVIYIKLSPLTVEWFIRQGFNYQIYVRQRSRAVVSALNSEQLKDWDKYPTYPQYDSLMQNFPKLFPSICRLDTIGTSINGKLVLALRISGTHDWRPAVLYTSTMHGDETGGFILMLHLADYLLKNYSSDQRIKNLLDNLEVWINPLANPDGTYWNGDTIISPVRFNANGYDLNRNFPDPETPNTILQKENKDMIGFMRKHKFVLLANFHSGSEVVNYPWDRYTRLHADDSWFYSISRAYADTAHVFGGSSYMNILDNGITRGILWYKVNGGRQDFATMELHGREVTIEIDDQYITPEAELIALWDKNRNSLIGYLENALYGIHGHVRNINSYVPVSARVFINGHDMDSSDVYSDTLSGNFVRFLSPGTWNLTFSAAGYRDTTISYVNVVSGQRTDLIVDMSLIEKAKSQSFITLYPNPARSTIYALLPDIISGDINVRIINQTGSVISDYIAKVNKDIPLLINIKSLSAGVYTVVLTDKITGKHFHGRFVVIR